MRPVPRRPAPPESPRSWRTSRCAASSSLLRLQRVRGFQLLLKCPASWSPHCGCLPAIHHRFRGARRRSREGEHRLRFEAAIRCSPAPRKRHGEPAASGKGLLCQHLHVADLDERICECVIENAIVLPSISARRMSTVASASPIRPERSGSHTASVHVLVLQAFAKPRHRLPYRARARLRESLCAGLLPVGQSGRPSRCASGVVPGQHPHGRGPTVLGWHGTRTETFADELVRRRDRRRPRDRRISVAFSRTAGRGSSNSRVNVTWLSDSHLILNPRVVYLVPQPSSPDRSRLSRPASRCEVGQQSLYQPPVSTMRSEPSASSITRRGWKSMLSDTTKSSPGG